jgi:hypothetical protein
MNAWMDTFAHGISQSFKGSGAVVNGFIGKNALVNISSFSIAAEYTTVVSVYTDGNLKE